MGQEFNYTRLQLASLVVTRMLVGWHLLYEGIVKLLSHGWSSATFLSESQWILSGFASWIISNKGVLEVVDFLNTWGLIAIGAGLILGLLSRVAALSGFLILMLYYLNNPPLIGMEYSVAMEGNYLVVSKTLIEAMVLVILCVFPTSRVFGLDYFIHSKAKTN